MSSLSTLSSRNLSSGLAGRTIRNLNFIQAAPPTVEVHVVTQVINSLLSILVFPIEKGVDPSSDEDIYLDLKQVSWTDDKEAARKLTAEGS
jgi:hypothetical protein